MGHMEWEKPVDDGGNAVNGYWIEHKDRNSIMWTTSNRAICRETSFRCTGLVPGLTYAFRVTAQNTAGRGKKSKESEEVVTRDACTPPRDLVSIRVRQTAIQIGWNRPECDGGSKITGYIIERLEAGKWLKCNFNKVLETTFDVTGLIKENEYTFRVYAMNAAGSVSEASDELGPITASDQNEPPSIEIEPELCNGIQKKVRDNLVLKAGIPGKPFP